MFLVSGSVVPLSYQLPHSLSSQVQVRADRLYRASQNPGDVGVVELFYESQNQHGFLPCRQSIDRVPDPFVLVIDGRPVSIRVGGFRGQSQPPKPHNPSTKRALLIKPEPDHRLAAIADVVGTIGPPRQQRDQCLLR